MVPIEVALGKRARLGFEVSPDECGRLVAGEGQLDLVATLLHGHRHALGIVDEGAGHVVKELLHADASPSLSGASAAGAGSDEASLGVSVDSLGVSFGSLGVSVDSLC